MKEHFKEYLDIGTLRDNNSILNNKSSIIAPKNHIVVGEMKTLFQAPEKGSYDF